MSKECPCIGCICVPICKHKYCHALLKDCHLIWDYYVSNKPAHVPYLQFHDYLVKDKKIFDICKP